MGNGSRNGCVFALLKALLAFSFSANIYAEDPPLNPECERRLKEISDARSPGVAHRSLPEIISSIEALSFVRGTMLENWEAVLHYSPRSPRGNDYLDRVIYVDALHESRSMPGQVFLSPEERQALTEQLLSRIDEGGPLQLFSDNTFFDYAKGAFKFRRPNYTENFQKLLQSKSSLKEIEAFIEKIPNLSSHLKRSFAESAIQAKSEEVLFYLLHRYRNQVGYFEDVFKLALLDSWDEGVKIVEKFFDWKKSWSVDTAMPHTENFVNKLAPLLLKRWREQLKKPGAAPLPMEDLLYVRDYLLKLFISNSFSADQAYHLLVELREFPVKVLTPQILSHAQIISSVYLMRLGIVPTWVGKMAVHQLGYLDAPSEQPGNRLKIVEADGAAPVFGYKRAQLFLSPEIPRDIYLLDSNLRRENTVFYGEGANKGKRIWQRFGIAVGSGVAYYRDVQTGLVVSICIDSFATQDARKLEWVAMLKAKIDRLILEKNEKADVIGVVDESISHIPPELRSSVIQIIKSDYPERASATDWAKLESQGRIVFWRDTVEQLGAFKTFVESYRQNLPEEANIDFPLDEKAKPLGFRIASDRGVRLMKDKLTDLGIVLDRDEDLEAYIRALGTINLLNAWGSLPIDRSILAVFREGIFDHPNPEQSHLQVLRSTSARMKIASQPPAISEKDARSNYVEAITAFDASLGITSLRK